MALGLDAHGHGGWLDGLGRMEEYTYPGVHWYTCPMGVWGVRMSLSVHPPSHLGCLMSLGASTHLHTWMRMSLGAPTHPQGAHVSRSRWACL